MPTFEKVLEVFGDYLAQDKACEVLTTSRGYLAVDWESCKNNWVTSRLCPTPEKLRDLLRFVLPLYREEGKTVLVVAIGCTGGHHRSVAVTHALCEYIQGLGYGAGETHRDMTRA